MIKNPKKYLLEQERLRKDYLKSLTEEESVRLLESLLTSGLVEEFSFPDHQPIALAILIQNAKKRV